MGNRLNLNFSESKMVLIDGHAIIHRAFHALPPLTNGKNEPVGAIYGFVRVLFKVIKDYDPSYLAIAFDHPGPTFRQAIFKEYKAKRAKAPEELYQQIPKIKELVSLMKIPTLEQSGFEADDLIGSLAKQVEGSVKRVIITGDADLLQLVDQRTEVVLLQKGLSQHQSFGLAEIKDKYLGLGPEKLIELKGLKGDASDNIPGVPGIGEKTGLDLIQRYGRLENIYAHLADLSLKTREKLESFQEQSFMSREIGRIKTDLLMDLSLEKYRQRGYNKKLAGDFLIKTGLKSLIKDLP